MWPFVIFSLLSYLLRGELIYNAAKSFTARNIRKHCEYKCEIKSKLCLRFSCTALPVERRDIEHEFVNIYIRGACFEWSWYIWACWSLLVLAFTIYIVRKADASKKEHFEIVARAALSQKTQVRKNLCWIPCLKKTTLFEEIEKILQGFQPCINVFLWLVYFVAIYGGGGSIFGWALTTTGTSIKSSGTASLVIVSQWARSPIH